MDVQEIVYNSIDELNEQLEVNNKIKKSLDTKLFGSSSNIDSLGLINLIVSIEQNIEDEFDLSLTIADERAMSQKNSPFSSVKSLIDYIEVLIEEHNK